MTAVYELRDIDIVAESIEELRGEYNALCMLMGPNALGRSTSVRRGTFRMLTVRQWDIPNVDCPTVGQSER